MHIDTSQSRRAFLRRASQLGVLGAAAPFASSLGLISEAAAAAATDYKALVCIFLYGGNDNWNTLIPYDSENYAAYNAARPPIAVRHAHLGGTVLNPANDLGGLRFALHPHMSALRPLFQQGRLAPILNIGNLVQPTNRAAYFNRSVRLPPKLFSHNDQQSFAQSFEPEGANAGWGGRMGDLVQSGNGSAALTCVTLQGRALWVQGGKATPYAISSAGVSELMWGATRLFGSGESFQAMRALMTSENQNNWIKQEHAKVVNRAMQLNDALAPALANVPASKFNNFNGQNPLSNQLRMVARLMTAGPSLGLRRQVFFVGLGGFDTHSGQNGAHPPLLRHVAEAMSEFHAASAQVGMASQVTTFTASDFGRTLVSTGGGSDHGWGGTHFVVGGAVKGGRIYGTPPIVGVGTTDDVGGGRLVPTTSMDQLAATLGLWFGLPAANLSQILPNLTNFAPSTWDLGLATLASNG